ncbi:MAG: hypothetical protein JWO94_65, partial [Verrucomicrobiaceae bacterium]|nr:hypothetical protein [Verrucomicrobiaceae bacterium]
MKPLRFFVLATAMVLAGRMSRLEAQTPVILQVTAARDTFVTPGPANSLTSRNFGGAGALEISGNALSKGPAKAVIQFDFAVLKTSFDQAFGVSGWKIDDVKLELTGSPPNNAIFNSPVNGGVIQVQWTPANNWVEGVGTPMSAANSPEATTGLVWQNFGSLTAGTENEGTLTFTGSQAPTDFPLAPSNGLLGDIASGALASLILTAADPTVTAVFNSSSFKTPANRPSLLVTASSY